MMRVTLLAALLAFALGGTAFAQVGANPGQAVAIWGRDSVTNQPCIVGIVGGATTCVVPTPVGGGGGGGSGANVGTVGSAAPSSAGLDGCQYLAAAPSSLTVNALYGDWCGPAGQKVFTPVTPAGGLFDISILGSTGSTPWGGTGATDILGVLEALYLETSPVPTYPQAFASTDYSGTTSSTSNTFTTLLTASTSRKGCSIFNPASNSYVLYIHFVSSTAASLTNSISILPGTGWVCNYGGIVISDTISVAAPVASMNYVASAQ